MAATQLKTRILIHGRPTETADGVTGWKNLKVDGASFVPLKNELCYDSTLGKLKIGDGITTYDKLSYLTYTIKEIEKYINDHAYTLPTASSDVLGGVKVGSYLDINNGVLSVQTATTGRAGVVQLNSATNSTDETTAATPKAVKSAYDKADAAMPKSGGTFTGAITLSGNPTVDLHAATKSYVDSQITSKLQTSDAMVFKGTLGATNGNVKAVPTKNVVQGDTYKIVDAGEYAGWKNCKVGDLIIANKSVSGDTTLTANTENWSYVPSGNEKETTIAYTTGTPSLSTSARTGNVTVGEAAIKQVLTTMDTSSTSTNLPTGQAVAGAIVSYAPKKDGTNASGTWGIGVTGNAGTATKLATARNISTSGGAVGTATSFDGSKNIAISITELNTDYLKKGDNTLILDGSI